MSPDAIDAFAGIGWAEGLRLLGMTGNYLLLDLKDAARAAAYVAFLKEQKIYIKGPWSAPWDRFTTITLGPIEVMARFVEATRAFCSKARAA